MIVVENVQSFLTRQVPHPLTGAAISAARLLVNLLDQWYSVFPIVVDLCDYGIPQSRVRSFLTFVDRTEPCHDLLRQHARSPYQRPTHAPDHGGANKVTIQEALAAFALPPLDAATKTTAMDPKRPLHRVPIWSREHHAMVAAIPVDSGRSAWENDQCGRCGPVDVGVEDAICPVCEGPLLRPVMRDEEGGFRLVTGFRNSSYRRMAPNRPASTVTTASNRLGSDITIHPSETRVLSPLECQLLQTIPSSFRWGPVLDRACLGLIRGMIGEAVPPAFTEAHGNALVQCMSGQDLEALLPVDDLRCNRAVRKLFGRERRDQQAA